MSKRTWTSPEHIRLDGRYVFLAPLEPERDAEALYQMSHGTPEKEAVFQFLFYGPFNSPHSMRNFLGKEMFGQSDPLVWTVFSQGTNTQVGIVALIAIVPSHGRAEIAHVWFTPSVHKTRINTESQFLLLNHLFDHHQYRRVEWKCDSLNHASRTTATRMGFTFEGRFRQHFLIKGSNRDTDWFAMLDKEWPQRQANFERWLYSEDNVSLMELNNG